MNDNGDPNGGRHDGAQPCFHCGAPVPPGSDWRAMVGGVARSLCCPGCRAVAETIAGAGHAGYYQRRAEPARNAAGMSDLLAGAAALDHPSLAGGCQRDLDAHRREATLMIAGISCAACVWLIERRLAGVPGVLQAEVNLTTHRLTVRWDRRRTSLGAIGAEIARVGYLAQPYSPDARRRTLAGQRRAQLRRLGVAGLLGMQVMTLSVALYGGAWYGMDPAMEIFFRWSALLLSVPVVAFCASPFLAGAWRGVRRASPGMDLPVTLGIALAFGASAWATFTNRGEVYFDSVAMFVFLLLGARYLELAARARAADATERLAVATPDTARRQRSPHGDDYEIVASAALRPGDWVQVPDGATLAADGVIAAGESVFSEAHLSGESAPVPKRPGDRVIGGSLNLAHPVTVRVSACGEHTVLASIVRLLERAHRERPRLARLADRAAGAFVLAVLLLALVTALYWQAHAPGEWLPVTVAVLIVTCPCALSLATPAAVTSALSALMREGVLVTRGDALENSTRVTHWVFDKTGTLTEGRPRLVRTFGLGLPEQEAHAIAAALERGSQHPLAEALRQAAPPAAAPAKELRSFPGDGVSGSVGKTRYWLGAPAFVTRHTGHVLDQAVCAGYPEHSLAVLADRECIRAAFVLGDRIRPRAAALVEELRSRGGEVWLLSGDRESAVQATAASLGIAHWESGLAPGDKLQRVRALQRTGAVVAMVGDGSNDSPVLAQAQVSIAMGTGARKAAVKADVVQLRGELAGVSALAATGWRTRRVIRQNLAWALLYNFGALPAAALGLVPPWLAAAGMSASSLVVVANALRLGRQRRPAHDDTPVTGRAPAQVA